MLGEAVEAAAGLGMSFIKPGERPAPTRISVKEDQIARARSPVRFESRRGLGRHPSSTPIATGEVVNLPSSTRQSPIQVFIRRTRERCVRITSSIPRRHGDHHACRGPPGLRGPTSPFALPKAASHLLGVGRGLGDDDGLEDCLGRWGRLELTLLCAVPKGFGSGTVHPAGTIPARARAVLRADVGRDELFLQVLEVEQMLTTGGGWQDQIGGIVGGVKYIESRPALRPSPIVYQL